MYNGPLFVEDESVVTLRIASDVAKRAMALWAIELYAEGVPKIECIQILDSVGGTNILSPKERTFLNLENPSEEECRSHIWRLESIWVMLWALGYIPKLDWPSDCCDVNPLAKLMRTQETNPLFISNAKLRSLNEILDAQDLILRIHWAIRNEYLNHRNLPLGLDWQNELTIPVSQSRAINVVEQWHQTLNWLVCLDNADWDNVDTST